MNNYIIEANEALNGGRMVIDDVIINERSICFITSKKLELYYLFCFEQFGTPEMLFCGEECRKLESVVKKIKRDLKIKKILK